MGFRKARFAATPSIEAERKSPSAAKRTAPAAPWRGCPLGLVHLYLREFCFCRKLEDARVG